MLSTDFDFYFREHANFYLGVFSADNYPKELNLFNFFIVNKDPSSEKGSHWMLVIRGKKTLNFLTLVAQVRSS